MKLARNVISVLFVGLLLGCANVKAKKNEEIANAASEQFKVCVQVAKVGGKAKCAMNFYSALLAIDDADYGKPAALKFATKAYAVFVKIDSNQLTEQDGKIQLMQATNEFQQDLQSAKFQFETAGRLSDMEQRQRFQDAQRLLSPVQSGTYNCRQQPGGPTGMMFCN